MALMDLGSPIPDYTNIIVIALLGLFIVGLIAYLSFKQERNKHDKAKD